MKTYMLDGKTVTKLGVYDASAMYIGGYILQLLLQFLLTVVMLATKVEDDFSTSMLYLGIITVINQGAIILTPLLYSKIKSTNVIKGTGFKWTMNPLQLLLVVIIAVSCFFAFQFLSTEFSELVVKTGYSTSGLLALKITNVKDFIICIIFMCLIPAVCEEILYRGIIGRSFTSKGFIWAIFMGGLLFAIMHGNPLQLVYQFFLGCVCCSVYFMTRNIYASMIIHFISNLIVIIGNYLNNFMNTSIELWLAIVLTIVGLVVLLGSLYLLFVVSTKKKNGKMDKSVSIDSKFEFLFKSEDEIKAEENEKNEDAVIVEQLSSEEAVELYKNKKAEDQKAIVKKDKRALIYAFGLAIVVWIINTIMGYVS